MAPMLLLALLLALLEALLLLLLAPLTSVGLSQLSERLALFGKRLLRLGGRAVLFQPPRDLALAPLLRYSATACSLNFGEYFVDMSVLQSFPLTPYQEIDVSESWAGQNI